MLVVEGVNIAHRSFQGMCSAWTILSRNCRKLASSASFRGRWQREFKGPSDAIFAGSGLLVEYEFCQQQEVSLFMVVQSPFVLQVAVPRLQSGEALLAIQSHGVSAPDSMGGRRSFCPIPSYIDLTISAQEPMDR